MSHSHLSCAPENIEDALSEAEAVCEARGSKLTRIRRKVLQLLLEEKGPAKAYDLLQKLDGEGAAKPPTVYRALDFLLEMGLAHKIESMNAYVACGHWGHSHMAIFMICTDCGMASEMHTETLGKILVSETENAGFNMKKAVVEVRGQCSTCPA